MDINNKRFLVVSEQSHGLAGSAYFIVVDTETGVNYLQTYYNGTSLTPLLNSMGEVVISSKKEIEELKENFN